jgi:uncharacterized protein
VENLGHYLALGLAMALVIEGAVYAIFPQQLKTMLQQIAAITPEQMRIGGLSVAGVGVALAAWLY